jgi:hypothetical protein
MLLKSRLNVVVFVVLAVIVRAHYFQVPVTLINGVDTFHTPPTLMYTVACFQTPLTFIQAFVAVEVCWLNRVVSMVAYYA